jgi:hypothetical protein
MSNSAAEPLTIEAFLSWERGQELRDDFDGTGAHHDRRVIEPLCDRNQFLADAEPLGAALPGIARRREGDHRGHRRLIRRSRRRGTRLRTSIVPLLALAILFLAPDAQARDDSALCEGSAIVTGTREETRAEGLARAFRDVLVKRSGDPALLHDPRADPLAANAAELVDDYIYLDRMTDEPKHDEQGTYDRPYTLIVRFAPAKIDAALTQLGVAPWLDERPKLLVRVMITDRKGGHFPLTASGDNDERFRQALLAASLRYGMHIVLPPPASFDEAASAARVLDVSGTLRWSDSDPGWTGSWHLAGEPGADVRAWTIKGVSFDDAFRNLVWGAMAIASGHTLP